jgi:protein SCO1/2
MLRRFRIAAWILVAVAMVGIGMLWLRPGQRPAATSVSLGGPFTLVGADGQPFASSRLNNRPYAMFFGFTRCPDVCPTTLARLVQLRNQLGKAPQAFDIVFVTVDPERDGPKEVGAYAQAFNSPIIGLTGSPAQIERVKKLYGIYSEKVPTGPGDYTVDHTATVLLFAKGGKFDGTIAHEEQPDAALAKLKRLTS